MRKLLDQNSMNQITHGLLCEKNKVRALYCKGYSRTEIANFLQSSNQHVRKVLMNSGYEDSEVRETSNSEAYKSGQHSKLSTKSLSTMNSTGKDLVMERIVEGMTKKADKIRALYLQGYSRSEIYKFLGVRYQHVRNVLVRSGYNETKLERPTSGVNATDTESAEFYPDSEWVKVGPAGRMVIPAKFRKAIGIEEDMEVLVELTGNQLHILTWKESLRRIQEELNRNVPEGVSIVDELIAERRQEFRMEETEWTEANMRQSE